MMRSSQCYLLSLLLYWICTISPVISLNDINIQSFGFKTSASQFFNTTNTVHVTLWFNFTIYKVTFNSLKFATMYTVSEDSVPSFSVIGCTNCHKSQYKMMITNSHKQPIVIDKVFVNQAFGVWFGVSDYYLDTFICLNNSTYSSSTCGPQQIIYFDILQSNKYIVGGFEDATNITNVSDSCHSHSYTNEPIHINDITIDRSIAIGKCDDLILDARSNQHLGGMNDSNYRWFIPEIDHEYSGVIVIVSNTELAAVLANTFVVKVSITHLETSRIYSTNITVYKAEENIFANVELHGVNQYTSKLNKLLNGKLDIYSSIIFENNSICNHTENERRISINKYAISWFVDTHKQTANTVLSQNKLHLLNDHLLSQSAINADSLSIDVHNMLQAGLNYDFTINITYNNNTQSVHSTHKVISTYSDVKCQIMGGDILLDNVTMDMMMTYALQLNGAIFTYDPDIIAIQHLDFEWKCMDDIGSDCEHLLDSTDSSIVNINLNQLSPIPKTTYKYSFTMNVYQDNCNLRRICSDSVEFIANIINKYTQTQKRIRTLAISTTAISNIINQHNTLRIIADISTVSTDAYDYEYKWLETNGLLSDAYIESNSETTHHSFNLVLAPHTLSEGQLYHFRVEVFRYNEEHLLIEYGISAVTDVYVNAAPHIIDDSLSIINYIITYDSINDWLHHYTYFSSVADSQSPLLYQYVYDGSYIHPNLLSTPVLNDVHLFIGNKTLKVNVYDVSSGAVSTSVMQCTVILTDDTQCFEDMDKLFEDLDLFLTDYDSHLYILQNANVYLRYILDYKPSIECVEDVLSVILTTLNDDISAHTLCQSNFVLMLSQVLQLWIDVALNNTDLIGLFSNSETDKAQMIRNLVVATLDPCDFITSSNISAITVSIRSMIRNVPALYYAAEDITSYLSVLQVNERYHPSLYALTQSLIEMVLITNDRQIYDLISHSLYIASLSTISSAIPGEQIMVEYDSFSLFARKISSMDHDPINVSINDATVYISISNDSISRSSLTDPVYFVMSAIHTNGFQCSKSGVLSNQVINIAIIDGIYNKFMIEFQCDDSVCDDSYKCVSYNTQCDTFVDTAKNVVECSCYSLIHRVDNACISLFKPTESVLVWKDWDIFNALYACLWMCIVIYIIHEIYPFFVDKHLTNMRSHIAVRIMCILSIISLFNFMVCMIVHFLKYGANNQRNTNIITALLLLSYNLYFLVYACILYTWFIVAHSMDPDVVYWAPKTKIILVCICIIITLLSWSSYIISIHNNDMHVMPLYSLAGVIAISWGAVISMLSVIFVYYTISVSRVLFTTFIKSSLTQRHARDDQKTAKKVFVINVFITVFFVSQSILCMFYIVDDRRFTIIPLIITLSLNLLFTVSLLMQYRNPMRRMIYAETKRSYNIYSWIHEHFKKNKDKNKTKPVADASRSNAVDKQSTIDMKQLHATQMSLTQSTRTNNNMRHYIQTTHSTNMALQEEEEEHKLKYDYDEIPHLTVYQCLEHTKGYQMFYDHCKKQYCADTVSAVTEFIQFQNRYNIQKKHVVKIPPLLPLSNIVQDDKLLMRDKVIALCNKYIVSGSEFELNISGTQKTDILKAIPVLEDRPDDECCCIFNDCVFSIIASLHDSFTGFQGTAFYQELKMTIFKEKRRLKAMRRKAKIDRVSLTPTQYSQQTSLTPTPFTCRITSVSFPTTIAVSRSISPP